MVPARRPSIHHCGICYGFDHGTWSSFPLRWLGPEEVSIVTHVGVHDSWLDHHTSMVHLGLFFDLFHYGHQRIHWRLESCRPQRCSRSPFCRIATDPSIALYILSSKSSNDLFKRVPLTTVKLQFCAVTGAIIAGAVAERGRLIPFCVWLFLWATLVYNPIACWAWNPNGWAYKWGVLDYAGGGPVEIGSALSAFAYTMILGKRNETMMLNFRPHNVSMILLGTILLWFGWLGFNGGSSYGANLRAVMACWNTNLTATLSAFTWMLLDWRLAKKWSMVGWCSGTISGLVAATPASGFITTWGSVCLGIATGFIANYATKVKYWVKIDDSLDIFAEHGVPGMIGLIFNAFFGADYIIGLDGVNTGLQNATTSTAAGGFLNGNYRQLYIQLAYVVTCTAYAFGVSAVLAYAVNYIPGLHLRASEEAELLGMDDAEIGEFAYDYVEVRRDFLAWTPATISHEDGVDPASWNEQRYGIAEHVAMAKSYSAKKASVDIIVNEDFESREAISSTEKGA